MLLSALTKQEKAKGLEKWKDFPSPLCAQVSEAEREPEAPDFSSRSLLCPKSDGARLLDKSGLTIP